MSVFTSRRPDRLLPRRPNRPRGVTSFTAGDRVFGYNEGPFGAHEEYLSIPQDASLATMPANVTFDQAAASTEGA